jgi:hypothetical protein
MAKTRFGNLSVFPHPTKPGFKRGLIRYTDPNTGKPGTKNFTAKTKSEVDRLCRTFEDELAEVKQTSAASHDIETVGGFIAYWRIHGTHKLQAETLTTYNHRLNRVRPSPRACVLSA